MATTIQRLTIYALISSLERDLREFLALHVAPLVEQGQLLPTAVRDKAIERFLKDVPDGQADQEDLLDYLDLGEEIQAIRAHDTKFDNVTRTYIRRHYLALEGVIPIRNRVMHSRPLEFDDLAQISNLSAELIRSHRALWANLRTLRRTLDRDPEVVATLSIPERPDGASKILHNLPQADFDDTGFIGREKELNELKNALRGSYPIVTVTGEGGLGKTAVALKACYDLLDDEGSGFDAVVWTTAKATRLTFNEIQHIEGAISSSIGIIESAAAVLGRQSETSAVDDLVMHLENNNILLVIDNLETVIDENIRSLVKRIPQGSRILFTTRIGLGAFDFPIPLVPLERKEAAFYFRRVAQVFGASDLSTAGGQIVDGYCKKLQHNPLYIKWFIQSIRAGKRPTALTTDPKLFLTFCLQNVFNSLSPYARKVAGALATLSGAQTVPSLAYFTDLDSISVQSSLTFLITSNLVSGERGRSAEDEDRYMLSPLARMYIQRFVRPDRDEQRRLISKQNALRTAQEEFATRSGSDIFDLGTVFVRDKDDYIVAKLLTKALERIFGGDLQSAEDEVQKARDLSPNYFEVHRVQAMVHIGLEDYFSAEAEYEAAISLASDRAPLRLWYAGFLSRNLGDNDRALGQLLKAEELAPNSAIIKLQCARILQYLRRLDDAEQRLNSIRDLDKLSAKTRRIHLDLSIQNDFRRAEDYSAQQQYQLALVCLESAREKVLNAPRALIDERTLAHIAHAKRHLPPLRWAFKGLDEEKRLAEIENWLFNPSGAATYINLEPSEELGAPSVGRAPHVGPQAELPNRGRLSHLHPNYGFVDTGATRLFFHRGAWVGKTDFLELGEGVIVEFDLGSNDRGECALNVHPITETTKRLAKGDMIHGAVKSLSNTFGFIKMDRGGDLFFHRSDCTPATKFRALAVGERVRCVFELDENGRRRGIRVEAFSGVPGPQPA